MSPKIYCLDNTVPTVPCLTLLTILTSAFLIKMPLYYLVAFVFKFTLGAVIIESAVVFASIRYDKKVATCKYKNK